MLVPLPPVCFVEELERALAKRNLFVHVYIQMGDSLPMIGPLPTSWIPSKLPIGSLQSSQLHINSVCVHSSGRL
ncbi:unnamed protein product [Boreogadus saida]